MEYSDFFDTDYTNHMLWLMSQLPINVMRIYHKYNYDTPQNAELDDFDILELIKTLLYNIDIYCDNIYGNGSYAKPTFDLHQKYKGLNAMEHFKYYFDIVEEYERRTSKPYIPNGFSPNPNNPIKNYMDYLNDFSGILENVMDKEFLIHSNLIKSNIKN